jgi:hypothetical protein
MGDVIQAGVVFVGERFALAVPAFASVNVVMAAAWLAVVLLLNVTLRRKAAEAQTAAL